MINVCSFIFFLFLCSNYLTYSINMCWCSVLSKQLKSSTIFFFLLFSFLFFSSFFFLHMFLGGIEIEISLIACCYFFGVLLIWNVYAIGSICFYSFVILFFFLCCIFSLFFMFLSVNEKKRRRRMPGVFNCYSCGTWDEFEEITIFQTVYFFSLQNDVAKI